MSSGAYRKKDVVFLLVIKPSDQPSACTGPGVDTNVYLDYLLERCNRQGNDLSIPAAAIFTRAIACEFELVLSDHVLNELQLHGYRPFGDEPDQRLLPESLVALTLFTEAEVAEAGGLERVECDITFTSITLSKWWVIR